MSANDTSHVSGFLHVSPESKEPYAPEVLERLRADAAEVIARYPQQRSALIPLLHLVQSVDGYVTGRGVSLCAELLDLTEAEVSGVATGALRADRSLARLAGRSKNKTPTTPSASSSGGSNRTASSTVNNK